MTIQQCINQVSRLNKYTKTNLLIKFFKNNERIFLYGVDLTKRKLDYFKLICDPLTNENILEIYLKNE